MRRTRAAIAAFIALLVAGFVMLSWPSVAQQEKPRSRNLLQFLFGSDEPEPVARKPVRTKQKAKSRKSASQAAARVDEPDALPKLDRARVVLVVGDFLASGLSEGLVSAYAQNPNIKVIDRSNGSSGFVRSDFHDWPKEIKALLEAEKPAAVIVMLGANDRQQMKVGENREAPLTEAWTKEYQARTDALAAAVKQSRLPLLWVGLPSFKSAKVSADLLAFNDVYRKSAENVGGSFVDIWDGFADENGVFVMNGPDMNGQPVKLRGSDGISFSKAGKRKVAFYVEKPLNKILGSETTPSQGPVGTETVGPVAPANIHVVRTQPMAIDDPELDGGQTLLGEKSEAKTETRTVGERLVVEGIAPAASPGRADDFGGAAAPVAADTAPDEATTASGTPVPAAETTNAIKQ